MLSRRHSTVLAGGDLPVAVRGHVDQVLAIDDLCCTVVALHDGQLVGMAVARSREAALRRLAGRVTRAAARR